MIDKNNKVLVTGCGGMVGDAVYRCFRDVCRLYLTDINLNEPWLERLDVTAPDEIKKYCDKVNPDFIINLAALTDLEYCELHPKEAYETNAFGVHNLVREAAKRDIPLAIISTAGVFDGAKDAYAEDDPPNPLSVYGKSKYLGDLIALNYKKSLVVRAGWMMGGGPAKDKKFVKKVMEQIKSGVTELAVIDDKAGTPCYTHEIARILRCLLDREMYGLYNGVCDDSTGSRVEVVASILSILGLSDKIKIKEVSSNYFQKEYFAPRPASEQLLNRRLKNANLNICRDWRVCLKEYLNNFNWLS